MLQTVSEPRKHQLLKSPPGTVHTEMIPPRGEDAQEAPPGGGRGSAPTAQAMDRGDFPPAPPATEADVESSLEPKTASKPKRSYLVPAVAIGTAAGVAAAVALFGPDPLNVAGMASDVFSDGVDWGNLVPADVSRSRSIFDFRFLLRHTCSFFSLFVCCCCYFFFFLF